MPARGQDINIGSEARSVEAPGGLWAIRVIGTRYDSRPRVGRTP
jgi:hypothetical protein